MVLRLIGAQESDCVFRCFKIGAEAVALSKNFLALRDYKIIQQIY
jgi:hypothetical protein